MINCHYETQFKLDNETCFTDGISRVIRSEDGYDNQIDFIFCSDDYLLRINQQYLDHDTYTDVITFDYSIGKELSGDIFISIDRVTDNARKLHVSFYSELARVMTHGVLHMLGYNDKTRMDIKVMREKETEKIELFHVEQ